METLEQNQSLSSFNVCPHCKVPDTLVDVKQFGTMVQVSTTCCNKKCLKRENTWKSQPHMTGTLIPAGNFFLSFAILVGGGSPNKLLCIFRHVGMACISLTTYFDHQRIITNGKYKML